MPIFSSSKWTKSTHTEILCITFFKDQSILFWRSFEHGRIDLSNSQIGICMSAHGYCSTEGDTCPRWAWVEYQTYTLSQWISNWLEIHWDNSHWSSSFGLLAERDTYINLSKSSTYSHDLNFNWRFHSWGTSGYSWQIHIRWSQRIKNYNGTSC